MAALTTRTWAAVVVEAGTVHTDALRTINDARITEEDALELLRMLKAVTLFLNTPADPALPTGVSS